MPQDNMDIWNALARPPQTALKRITGGRLSGKSDINPQWRLMAMTEQFGACGMGWSYEIVRFWTEPGADGEVAAFCQVNVDYGDSTPVPGVGGSMLVEKEKNGLHTNDEAFKMALTDGISVALKAIGVAADIYLGLFDGSKYSTPPAVGKPSGEADAIHAELMKLLGDKKMDGTLDEKAYQAGVAWLDGHLRTIPGMSAAKRSLEKRFAMGEYANKQSTGPTDDDGGPVGEPALPEEELF